MTFAVFLIAFLTAQAPTEQLRSLVERAQEAERQERLDEAVSLYKEILRIRPGWASAELNLGLVYHSRREYNAAIDTLSEALRHNPELHSALLFRGASYYSTGRFDAAAGDLEKYLQNDPGNPEALSYLADSYVETLGDGAAEKLASIAPDSAWVWLLRARNSEQHGRTAEAEQQFERAIAAPDAGLESLVRFGQFQCKQGRFDRCLGFYEKALALEPENPRVSGLAGEVHAMQDRPAKAVPYLERALRANPQETQTRLYLAQCLIRLERVSEAISVLQAAPEDPDGRVHYLLGRTYQQQGESEKAREAMKVFRQRRRAVKP
jgi:tetratricopeptide (TPR) repeat protein